MRPPGVIRATLIFLRTAALAIFAGLALFLSSVPVARGQCSAEAKLLVSLIEPQKSMEALLGTGAGSDLTVQRTWRTLREKPRASNARLISLETLRSLLTRCAVCGRAEFLPRRAKHFTQRSALDSGDCSKPREFLSIRIASKGLHTSRKPIGGFARLRILRRSLLNSGSGPAGTFWSFRQKPLRKTARQRCSNYEI